MPARDKRSSLLRIFVNYGLKKFYNTGPWTLGKGVMTPIQKLIMLVTDVMVIDTAASSKEADILSGTGVWTEVRRHAPSMTNVSSMPMPVGRTGAAVLGRTNKPQTQKI